MRRFIKRLFVAVVLLVLLVAGAVAAFLATADFNAYRDEIAARIEAATNRKVTFRGDLEIDLFRLSPAIVINDVAFANADWGSRPEMIRARRIEAHVALFPLVFGDIVIREFVLAGADILLETGPEGRQNWRLGTESAGESAAAGPADVPFVAAVRIEDTRIVYRDGFTDLETVFRLDRIRAETPDPGAGIRLSILGNYDGTDIAAEGRIGSVDAALRGAPDYPVELDASFGESDMTVELQADLSARTPKVTGTVESRILNLDELGGAAGGDGSNELFTEEDLPIGALRAIDADIRVRAESMIFARQRLEEARALFSLAAGDFRIDLEEARTAGGTVAGRLRLDLRQRVPAFVFQARGEGIALAEVTRRLADRVVVDSEMTFAIDLRGAGRSSQAIANSLQGMTAANLGSGAISGAFYNMLSTDLVRAVLPWTGGNREPRLNCGVARFDFAGGIGRSRILVADSTRATVFGGGSVNLRSERLDLRIRPAVKGVSLGAVTSLVPLRVTGPILEPQVGPDPSGVPENVGEAILDLPDAARSIFGSVAGEERPSDPNVCADARGVAAGQRAAPRSGSGTRQPGDILRRLNPFD